MYPLDYFLWDLVKTKVYQGRAGKKFSSEEELKQKIKAVWKDSAADLKPLPKAVKQFVPKLGAIEKSRDIESNWYWLIEWIVMVLLSYRFLFQVCRV